MEPSVALQAQLIPKYVHKYAHNYVHKYVHKYVQKYVCKCALVTIFPIQITFYCQHYTHRGCINFIKKFYPNIFGSKIFLDQNFSIFPTNRNFGFKFFCSIYFGPNIFTRNNQVQIRSWSLTRKTKSHFST